MTTKPKTKRTVRATEPFKAVAVWSKKYNRPHVFWEDTWRVAVFGAGEAADAFVKKHGTSRYTVKEVLITVLPRTSSKTTKR